MVEVGDLYKLNEVLKGYDRMVLLSRYDGANRELRLTFEAGGGPEENVEATVIFDEAVNISLPSVFHNAYVTFKEMADYSEAKSLIGDPDFADDEEFLGRYRLFLILKNGVQSPYYILAHKIRGLFKGSKYYEDQIRG